MSTISASTVTDAVFQYPNHGRMDRRTNGELWTLVPFASNVWWLYMSSDNGSNWTQMVSFTRASITEMGSIFVDNLGYLHVMYMTNESSQDRIYYQRIN